MEDEGLSQRLLHLNTRKDGDVADPLYPIALRAKIDGEPSPFTLVIPSVNRSTKESEKKNTSKQELGVNVYALDDRYDGKGVNAIRAGSSPLSSGKLLNQNASLLLRSHPPKKE
ncbi:hypothetical protein FNV43_RR08257 [Rhamnella rubrinervis]|uniref:Uncharacterized protein n=1 Tax=Rhamnella rubrinervis TaxID=2594499 RepID=A0A8K0HI53_9ROSA|nr:hypothetical protein FNV43_RR08257 [Rhamnella rubrinervis]